jgi:hypothetical protein
MSRHAIIKDGEVVNVVVWEGAEFLPPRGHMVVHCKDGRCDIGDKWDDVNKVFIYADRTAKE